MVNVMYSHIARFNDGQGKAREDARCKSELISSDWYSLGEMPPSASVATMQSMPVVLMS